MKKNKKQHRTSQPLDIDRLSSRQPVRKVKETADGGLLLDDRDADEPFLKQPRAKVKRVA